MKRLISLILLACLLAACVPAWAEEGSMGFNPAADETKLTWAPGWGYNFDFTVKLHPEALSPALREKAQGYADLLGALRFRGSYAKIYDGMSFELKLYVTPVDYPDGTVEIWLRGADDLMYLSSNLFGWKTLWLGNYSMLPFCFKMNEHLEVPLHYLALLVPYTWEYGMRFPVQDWNYTLGRKDKNGVVSEKDTEQLRGYWTFRLTEDEPFKALVTALCQDRDVEDAFRGFTSAVPNYFYIEVLDQKTMRVLEEEGKFSLQTAGGETFFTRTETEHGVTEELDLPRMEIGYQPVWSLETYREMGMVGGSLRAKILGTDYLQDLLNLEASVVAVPEKWPADCYSLLSLNLTGGLFPNVGLSSYLEGSADGHLRMVIRKPTVDGEPGAELLTVEGELLPLPDDTLVREFTFEDKNGALNLFVSNDADIKNFLPDLVKPLLEGMLKFLIGIPTSACQTIMDDLTDLGVFRVLTGE